MRLIDSHGHLNLPPLVDNWEEVLDRSLSREVVRVVAPGTNLASSRQSVKLAETRREVLAAVGLHPTEVDTKQVFAIEPFRELAESPVVVALGEVGIDIYRSAETYFEQMRVFEQFVELAERVHKPLIIHIRAGKTGQPSDAKLDPYQEVVGLLAARSIRPRFVIHCFQGNQSHVDAFLALGGYVSFTGTITYTKDPFVTELLAACPLERVLIETDSPYLSPVPYRGETNEPWKVVEVARKIAEVKGISVEAVAVATTENAERLFGLAL